jgi:molybdopterin molybdotransferase
MALMPASEALALMLGRVAAPTSVEQVPVAEAAGRVLAQDLAALRTHPPLALSAMDGYALRAADAGSALRVIGESAAGRAFVGPVGAGEAVRIFTGAALPEGADAVMMQENVTRGSDGFIRLTEPLRVGQSVRPAGLDFTVGDVCQRMGEKLTPAALGLAASLGHGSVSVRSRPVVALFSTGDELVAPGETARPDQIISSNALALAALLRAAGAEVVDHGIVPDDRAATRRAIASAMATADLLVTSGGASVGDHDHMHAALQAEGFNAGFWKVAIRPGKPVMFAYRGAKLVLGLPGNPVSAHVAALRFGLPLVRALAGERDPGRLITYLARLTVDVPLNDHREDHLRARLMVGPDGVSEVTPFSTQDSSMQSILAQSNALILRAPHAGPAAAGELVPILPIG